MTSLLQGRAVGLVHDLAPSAVTRRLTPAHPPRSGPISALAALARLLTADQVRSWPFAALTGKRIDKTIKGPTAEDVLRRVMRAHSSANRSATVQAWMRQISASAERVCDGHQHRRQWMLALVDKEPSGDTDGAPVPDVCRGTEGRPGPVLFTLDVDGERFAIRQHDGGTAYDWLSGPNKGYGFASSAIPSRSMEEHQESIRTFLAMIDPNTGYIGDD